MPMSPAIEDITTFMESITNGTFGYGLDPVYGVIAPVFEPVREFIRAIFLRFYAFWLSNPVPCIAIAFFIYDRWKKSQPWPDYGGRITKIEKLAEWDALLAKDKDKVVIVDAYALWCPPCKSAAPVYAKLSEAFSEDSCTFAKVDVDHARDVSSRLGISAMPTFKVFKGGKEVAVQQGWPGEAKIKELLLSHGAKVAPEKPKEE